jgi:putative ABC transport system permease protein
VPGNRVRVKLLEGDRRELDVPVAAIVEGYLGLGAYMELDALNRLLGQDALISGVNITVDPLAADALFEVLKKTPSAGFIALQSVALQQFRATMAQSLFIMVGVLVGPRGVDRLRRRLQLLPHLALRARTGDGEPQGSRLHPRGSLSLLLTEIAAVTLAAQPLGWFIGYIAALGMTEGFSTEIFQMPLVVTPDVYAYSSIAVILAAILSGLVVRRRIDRLDMIAVLKTRE